MKGSLIIQQEKWNFCYSKSANYCWVYFWQIYKPFT